jgi:patatin-like phospholipase/acyl hydrolase
MSRFNVLCLSGGGFLGLYSASVVDGLEERTGDPIARHVDLLAGTSVGGSGLALEVPAASIKSAFERNGTDIFSNRPAPTTKLGIAFDLVRALWKPKYGSEALRRTITEIVGNETRLGDLKHRVIVPAVNLTKGRPQVFKTPHHIDYRTDLHLKVIDVALATAAAPTYFPIARSAILFLRMVAFTLTLPISWPCMKPSTFCGSRLGASTSLALARPRHSFRLRMPSAGNWARLPGGASSAWSM